MKKLGLLILLIGNVFAGGLETQAKVMGEAKSIALYWQERVENEQRALEGCEAYANQTFTDDKLKAISVKACIDNFKMIVEKQK